MAATAIRAGLPGGHAEPAPEPHRPSSDVMSIILQPSLVNASSPYLRSSRWRWWAPDYRGLSSPGRGGRCRDRPCGFGVGRGGLHIRPGSVIEESAESCGNAPALNAGGILPMCRGARFAHGRASPGSRRFAKTLESRENSESAGEGDLSPMCNTLQPAPIAAAFDPNRPPRQRARAGRRMVESPSWHAKQHPNPTTCAR